MHSSNLDASGKLVLRLTVGILLLLHGIFKLRHGVDGLSGNMIEKRQHACQFCNRLCANTTRATRLEKQVQTFVPETHNHASRCDITHHTSQEKRTRVTRAQSCPPRLTMGDRFKHAYGVVS